MKNYVQPKTMTGLQQLYVHRQSGHEVNSSDSEELNASFLSNSSEDINVLDEEAKGYVEW